MAFYIMGSQMAMLSEPIPSKYCQVFDLPPEYVGKAIELAKLFEQAIGSDLKFSLPEAMKIARNAGLNVQNVIDFSVSQSNTSANQLFAGFTSELKSRYGIILSKPLIDQASSVFIYAFSNLHEEHRDAWIFWSEDHGSGKSYQYRTLYATTADIDGRAILTFIPLSLTVSVDVVTERVLCHVNTTMNSCAVAQGMVITESIGLMSASASIGAITAALFDSVLPVGIETMPNLHDQVPDLFKAMGYKYVRTMNVPM